LVTLETARLNYVLLRDLVTHDTWWDERFAARPRRWPVSSSRQPARGSSR
jgi:hypothetical protein